MAKEVKKEVRSSADNRPKMNFAFTAKNYQLMLAGIIVLIIGYITLSGGGSKDPNVFSEELFSARRMVVAPIILILGYGLVAYSIMIRENKEEGGEQQ